jgi:flagellar FliL protein
MLDEATAPAADAEPAPPQPGKRRKLLIAGAVAALLAFGSGGAYYFLASRSAVDDPTSAQKAPNKSAEKVTTKTAEKVSSKTAEKAPSKPMLYVPMESFTVNLGNVDQERYLQVSINLGVADTGTANSLKEQMPSIRNSVLLLLSSQEAKELLTREGKAKLAAEIIAELRKTLDGPGPSKGLEQILFSHFVIQ